MASRIASASIVVVTTASISVVGEALPPPRQELRPARGVVAVAPPELVFGYQAYGTKSATQNVTVRGLDGSARIAAIRVDGVAASSFEIRAGAEPGTLAEDADRVVQLAFAPRQWRPGHEARLLIQTDRSEHSVRVWGPSEARPALHAVAPTGTPPRIEFGAVKLLATSSVKTVTFRNIGPTSYRATGGELGPRGLRNWHPQDFRIVKNTCVQPVPPAATCVVGFTFRASGTDQRIADYKLFEGATTKYVTLRGFGNAL
jgi:hypothetical protein